MSAPSLPVIRQTAGAAPRAAARRSATAAGSERRPAGSRTRSLGRRDHRPILPLYYAFLLGVVERGLHRAAPDPVADPAGRVLQQRQPGAERRHPVLEGARQLDHRRGRSPSLSVVLFSTLAGFSFSKLRFRGRNGLLVFVIATTAVPTQLGHRAAVHRHVAARLDRQLSRGHRAGPGHARSACSG